MPWDSVGPQAGFCIQIGGPERPLGKLPWAEAPGSPLPRWDQTTALKVFQGSRAWTPPSCPVCRGALGPSLYPPYRPGQGWAAHRLWKERVPDSAEAGASDGQSRGGPQNGEPSEEAVASPTHQTYLNRLGSPGADGIKCLLGALGREIRRGGEVSRPLL